MTEEKFNFLKNLQDKIEVKESKIRNIDLLMASSELSCKITGTPKNSFRFTPGYSFSNKEEILKILQIEKNIIESELIELKKVFNEQ